MIRIIENALTDEQFQDMLLEEDSYGTGVTKYPNVPCKFINLLVEHAKEFYDVSEVKSLEHWKYDFHKGLTIGIDWHIDFDTSSFDRNVFIFPIYTAIYYPFVEDLNGGEIHFKNKFSDENTYTHKPKTNDLILLDPRTWMSTSKGTCTRYTQMMFSMYKENHILHHAYNTWLVPPKESYTFNIEGTEVFPEYQDTFNADQSKLLKMLEHYSIPIL